MAGAAVWLFLKAKIAAAGERGRGEAAAETAALAEKVVAREETIEELRARLQEKDATAVDLQRQVTALTARGPNLARHWRKSVGRPPKSSPCLDDAKRQLTDAFKALAAEALKSSNTSFLELAKTQLEKFQESARGDLEKRQTAIDELVKPVKESLGKVDAKLQELEKTRLAAYTGLTEQVRSMADTQKDLRGETANLVRALRRPQARGRWGEIQLRRVVEMAGMLDHCDFFEQQNTNTEDGRLRPDLVVRLPGHRTIAVDSKVPLEAYLEAIEAPDDETRSAKLKEHARQVRNHISALSKKSYAEHLERSPDFVVLFLPGEIFYLAALEYDPGLLEAAIERTDTDRGAHVADCLAAGRRLRVAQEQQAENAKEISKLGQELYNRLSTFAAHVQELGKGLDKAVHAYNIAVGSLERNVLVGARRFKELGAASGDEIKESRQIETSSRLLQAPELLPSNDEKP